jgi:putative spermidine/putrescine transport system substrate-binding protein
MAKLLQSGEPKKLRQIDRRAFLKGAGAVGAGIAAGPLLVTKGRAQASTVIRYADDGGFNFDLRMQHYLQPFMDETGIEIQHFVGQRNLAKMRAMYEVGNLEFDMSNELGTVSAAADNAGYLEEIDTTQLDLSQHMFPEWVFPGTIAWQFYSGVIGYNAESLEGQELPTSWAGYFDFAGFPGRRGMLSRPNDTLEQALLADGVLPSEMYPLDLDRAYAVLDRVKAEVAVWIDDTGQTIELLQAKEVDYCYTTSARVVAAQTNGVPLGMITELPISPPQNVHIMRDTPVYDACMQLAAHFIQNVESGTSYFMVQSGYGPTNQPTFDALTDEVRAKLPSRDNEQALWTDIGYWAENLETVTERHKLWLLT